MAASTYGPISNIRSYAPAQIVQSGTQQQALDVGELVDRELVPWLNQLNPFFVEADKQWEKWFVKPLTSQSADNPFISKVQVPTGHHAVEVLVPRILGENPKIGYEAVDSDDDDLCARLNGAVASWQLKRMRFGLHARDFIRQALVTDYSVAKVGWIREEAYRQTMLSEQHQIGPYGSVSVEVPGHEKIVVRNEPFFETVNIRDFVYPIYARSIDEAPCVWQRRWVDKPYLENMQRLGVYSNVDQVTTDSEKFVEAYNPQFASQGLVLNAALAAFDGKYGLVELWERWEDNRLTVIANRQIILRDEPNPFQHKRKPFVDYTPTPRPFQMPGVGTMRIINDLSEDLNTLRRQKRDAITKLLNPMYKAVGGLDTDQIVFQAGGVVPVDADVGDLEPLTMPNIDFGAAVQEEQNIQQDIERTTGSYELFGGAFPLLGSRTATGISTIMQQATMIPSEMVTVFSERTMRRLAQLLLEMNAQYLDVTTAVNVSTDPDAAQAWMEFVNQEVPRSGLIGVTPEMLRPDGRLEPVPLVGQDKSLSDTQKRSDATQYLQALAPIFASPMNPLNMSAVTKWVASQFDVPEREVKQMLATPQVQQQAMMTEAQGNTSSPSGPSGENLPTGGVVGAPGAAGGSGPPGLGPGR